MRCLAQLRLATVTSRSEARKVSDVENSTSSPKLVNPAVATLRTSATALRAAADAQEALADSLEHAPASADEMIVLATVIPGRTAQDSAIRQGLAVAKGPRRRRMVRRSEWLRWIESRPVQPRPPAKRPVPADSLETWEQQVAAELGGRHG